MKFQGSGFLLGLVVGLLVGLSLALGVAIYVNKVPIPFVNKVPQRTADQDAAEAEKNRNWDPNSALRSKAAMPPSGEASAPAGAGTPAVGRPATAGGGTPPSPGATGVTTTPPAPGAAPPATAAATNRPLSDAPAVRGGPAAGTGAGARDPAAILGDAAASAVALAKPASAAAPRAGPDPFIYFVQAGAFGQSEDAEQQRAKLAMLGYEARLSEREQSGRTMFRVRVGPYEKRDEAEAAKEKLTGAGVEASLVRVHK